MPYYWKRGLVAALVVGGIMQLLVQKFEQLHAQATPGIHHTPFAPLIAVILFALFCVMPGPQQPRE